MPINKMTNWNYKKQLTNLQTVNYSKKLCKFHQQESNG